MKKKLGIVFAVAMGLGGCAAGEEPETSTASVELGGFTEEAVAGKLGAGWTRVEAGVFERRGEDGKVQRVAAGRSGLDADIARWRAELARLEAAPARPATAAAEEYLETLRARVARLEAMQVEKATGLLQTSQCNDGTVFFAESQASYGLYDVSLAVTSGWGYGFGPRVPSEAYAYVGLWTGGWFPVGSNEDFGNSYDPASASFASSYQSACQLSAYAWVSPQCPEGYLSFSDYADCSL
jgi:hypothetical protein